MVRTLGKLGEQGCSGRQEPWGQEVGRSLGQGQQAAGAQIAGRR